MSSKEEILAKIAASEVEQKDARSRVSALKRELLDAETHLIHCSLTNEKLVEELRVHNNTTVTYEPSERDKDIERFRLVLPELLTRKP